MQSLALGIALYLVLPAGAPQANQSISSYSTAKKKLEGSVYPDHQETLYCGCRYRGKDIDHESCGYVPQRSENSRAYNMEWEHVVPASAFGRGFYAWVHGDPRCVRNNGHAYRGRDCARKVSREFRLMEADLYNLFPAVGEVNEARSNHPMGLVSGESRSYGACDVEISGRIEPRPDARGDIARAYLYMASVYPTADIIDAEEEAQFLEWAENDPVDFWECERARRIATIQGNRNPWVEEACELEGW